MTPGASHDNDSDNVTQNERVLNTLTNNWAGASQQQTRPGTAKFSRIAFDKDKPVNLKYGLGMTQGYQLTHSLSLLKPLFDIVLVEHGGLPNVLPPALHLEWRGTPS